ncbi:hypothetical protein NZK35_21810 [Stieleria sp. ICT_E10.1]|uniref:hypothetical protein n=1 Tax=Stieleria sedimenti TaxID=2976331 RepID=UPI00218055C1|nr:hypothetical protein [Stieleria sedimenti]MCS7469295.1 hypothetical protein [Stieleria sedimenti]
MNLCKSFLLFAFISITAQAQHPLSISVGDASITSSDSAGPMWLRDRGVAGDRFEWRRDGFGRNHSAPPAGGLMHWFINRDSDNSLGLTELELPQTHRFLFPRLDEDGNGELSRSEIGRFETFALGQFDGLQLRSSLWSDDAPSIETTRRLKEVMDSFLADNAESDASAASEIASTNRAAWTSYVFTVAAMMIAAFSFGHLLTTSPPRRHRWTHIDASPDATRSVVESLVLISLLSVIDLFWTTIKSTETHFHEMNPLGNQILLNGDSLTAFKVISVLVSLTVLFFLRQYKGAQHASWWGCLICTLVAFRWIVLDSAMLG